MKKALSVLGNIILYFVIVLGIGVIFDKIWGLDVSVWLFAVTLTIGWGIWQTIKFCINKIRDKQ